MTVVLQVLSEIVAPNRPTTDAVANKLQFDGGIVGGHCVSEVSMAYRLSVESASDGHFVIAVHDADGEVLMTSSRFARERTLDAIHTVRRLMTRDWCYRIVNRRSTGLRFTLHLPHGGIRCVSRAFSSGDALEAEIERLKSAAPSMIWFHKNDIDHSPAGQGRGDEPEGFAARLTESA